MYSESFVISVETSLKTYCVNKKLLITVQGSPLAIFSF